MEFHAKIEFSCCRTACFARASSPRAHAYNEKEAQPMLDALRQRGMNVEENLPRYSAALDSRSTPALPLRHCCAAPTPLRLRACSTSSLPVLYSCAAPTLPQRRSIFKSEVLLYYNSSPGVCPYSGPALPLVYPRHASAKIPP